MNYVEALGSALRKVNSVRVDKDEIHDKLMEMAIAIHGCPVRNKECRDFDTVVKCCSNIVGEYAIVKALTSLDECSQLNPHNWHVGQKMSYMYDVEHQINDRKYLIEFKRMAGAWFSMQDSQLKTFKKHAHELDALVTAYIDEYPDHYTVIFSLVINPKTFEHYWTPSNFAKAAKKSAYYYSHHIAKKRSDCSLVQVLTTRTKEYYDNLNFVIEDYND